jgi:hypothetical protein
MFELLATVFKTRLYSINTRYLNCLKPVTLIPEHPTAICCFNSSMFFGRCLKTTGLVTQQEKSGLA